MNKVVYNRCFGGFCLSVEAMLKIFEKKNQPLYVYKRDYTNNKDYANNVFKKIKNFEDSNSSFFTFSIKDFGDEVKNLPDDCMVCCYDLPRHDKELVQVIEELGYKANGDYADLAIKEIEGNVYRIDEYDGNESVITPDTSFDWVIIEPNDK